MKNQYKIENIDLSSVSFLENGINLEEVQNTNNKKPDISIKKDPNNNSSIRK